MDLPTKEDAKRAAYLVRMLVDDPEAVPVHIEAFLAFSNHDTVGKLIMGLTGLAATSTEVLLSHPDSLSIEDFLDKLIEGWYNEDNTNHKES